MPLQLFARPSSPSLPEADYSTTRPEAEAPPPLGYSTANLFDTFPRIVFGGYRKYYHGLAQSADEAKEEEEDWSWRTLPEFTGKKPRRRKDSHSSTTHPRLRKKPHFSPSTTPLVDTTYAWPDWLTYPGGSFDASDSSQASHSDHS